MTDRFQGDPKLFITPDGVDFEVKGGQPAMDAGFSNQAQISLFTSPGWWGNLIDGNEYGSDFEQTAQGPITLTRLEDIRQSGIRALQYQAFGNIDGQVVNPTSSLLRATFTVSPRGRDARDIIFTRNGQNWINQAEAM